MLSIQGITKFYGSHTVLRNVTMPVSPGEIVGLFGANGAGKTTLFKSVMGLLVPNDGWVTIDNSPIKNMAYEKIAFITEEGSYFTNMTPRAHSGFYEAMLPKWNGQRFVKLLDFFELPHDKKVRTFSKGQRAKLEVAVGMSRGASYILMDEPFNGKDIFTRRDFLTLLSTIIGPSESIIIATHQIEEIEAFITRAVVLHGGKIAGDIPTKELKENNITLADYIKKKCGFNEKADFDWAGIK
jgi:ABC-2 type transport system ATP-binding protein